ncbi:hypothetical protein D9615_007059 [Tricholomella constricta]|uniref:WD40 repeat-like protein n=1 Tax=Tricholomella constricta TaxID=117010 RepID=A0A8H5H8C8_9AGAR|nr:hypothetical protein D9615_007059 [Tricholomella constricta]
MPPLDPINLPIVTIDPTFPAVIGDVHAGIVPSEKFWVSCYKTAQPSVHAKIQAELDDKDRNLMHLKAIEGEVGIQRGSDGVFRVACPPLGMQPTPVLPPMQEYLDPERSNPQHPQRITAFDISPDSTRFATGFLDGSVFLYPVSPFAPVSIYPAHGPPSQITTPPTAARPHLSTTTNLQFFRSSRALLSAGADFSLSILPADLSPSSTRITPTHTLRGHTRPITATVILGAGHEILSTSLDGTLKFWNTSISSTPVLSIPSFASQPILSAALGTDQMLWCGLQDGSIQLFDLRRERPAFRCAPSGAGGVAALAHDAGHHLLAAGSTAGVVRMFDTRVLGADTGGTGEVTSFVRGRGGIESLAFVQRAQGEGEAGGLDVVVATADGLPYVAAVLPDGPGVSAELVGGDCDAVRCVRARSVEEGSGWDVWSAGDDAVVRRWRI